MDPLLTPTTANTTYPVLGIRAMHQIIITERTLESNGRRSRTSVLDNSNFVGVVGRTRGVNRRCTPCPQLSSDPWSLFQFNVKLTTSRSLTLERPHVIIVF